MLSSPIILYDHPEVAQQSPGDLYDALEIDEILALRVMTLTDTEKAEARGTDARAAAIIDRCDSLTPEAMGRLHGQMRPRRARMDDADHPRVGRRSVVGPRFRRVGRSVDGLGPCGRRRAGAGVRRPAPPVRDRRTRRTCSSTGGAAPLAGVFADVDGGVHLAVTLDDDPAATELMWQGRYLYFRPDEVEPMPSRQRTDGRP